MIFPKKTEFNNKIPKERFYENLDIPNKIKERFKKEISAIYLKNKLSNDTLHIKGTKNIEEIFVFYIKLKEDIYFEKIEDLLLLIDRAIPYPVLYEFSLEDKTVYKIAHKERSKNNENESVVDVYFTREMDKGFEKDLKNLSNSLNLEILYEKLVKAIIGLKSKRPIGILVQEYKNKKLLETDIIILEKRIKLEKQPDRQFELLNKLGLKKKELKKLQ